jgi:sarcosine oxidase subunit beta
MKVDYLIVGGGVLGQAIAWRLAKNTHLKKIVLVDKAEFSQATSSQAAALVTHGRSNVIASELVQVTDEYIQQLNPLLDQPVPFQRCGGIHLAVSKDEQAALQQMKSTADILNIACTWLSQSQVAKKLISFDVDNVLAALYFPDDGHVDGTLLADSYGQAARKLGVNFKRNYRVSTIEKRPQDDGYDVLFSNQEKITCSHLIMCAGPWSANLLNTLSISLPVAPLRSLYWISEDCFSQGEQMPVCVAPWAQAYFRQEVKGMLFGVRDKGLSLHPDLIPDDVHGFAFNGDDNGYQALTDAWPKLNILWPGINQLGLVHHVSGISSYSPDALPVLGAPPQINNLTLVSGCSGAGIAYSGGIAKYAVQHILTGQLPASLNMNRFNGGCAYDDHFRQTCLQARSQKKAG